MNSSHCTNGSNCKTGDLRGTGFQAFVICMAVLIFTSIFFNIIVITTLCAAHSVAKLVRIFLINLLAAGLYSSVTAAVFSTLSLILNITSYPPPSLWLCRFLIFVYTTSSVTRIYSLAAFSMIVLMMVKYNKRSFKTTHIIAILVLVWSIGFPLGAYIMIPAVYTPQYYNSVACFAQRDIKVESKHSLSLIKFIFGGFVPLVVSIIVPILLFCHVRQNTTVTAGRGMSYNKGMARFAFFLVTANFLNFLVQITIGALVFSDITKAIYLAYSAGTLIHFPTPILINVFLKPVRNKISSLFVSSCCYTHKVQMANRTVETPLIKL